jgi:hypothetical protein
VRVRQRWAFAWQVLVLRWEDGGPRAAEVLPPFWPGHEHAVVFWVGGGRVANARIEPGCPTYGFDVSAVEWLLPGGGP